MRCVSRSSGETASTASVAPTTPPTSAEAHRGQVEPIAALVALLAVGAGLGLYAVALDDAAPDRERDVATPTIDRVERQLTTGGVADPSRVAVPDVGIPADATVAVVLRAGGESWHAGTTERDVSGERTTVVERRLTVRVAPGENVPGTLRVVVSR